MIRVVLPWPDKVMWPNGRPGHPQALARVKKKYKHAAEWATIAARGLAKFDHDGSELPVRLTIRAKPTGPLPDKDNCIAAMKVGLDAIAAQIGVNDRHFAAPTVEFAEPRNGTIEVQIG